MKMMRKSGKKKLLNNKGAMLNIKLLKENLVEISSKDMQLALWLNGDENNMSSFTEVIGRVTFQKL